MEVLKRNKEEKNTLGKLDVKGVKMEKIVKSRRVRSTLGVSRE